MQMTQINIQDLDSDKKLSDITPEETDDKINVVKARKLCLNFIEQY